MKIEVLYPEIANLYGDLFNIYYLDKTIPNLKIYYTNLNETPRFVSEKIDFIYMGSMMEKYQEVVIKKLRPYKKKIKELIENDVLFLITGTALEIFGSKIDDIKGLGIFETITRRDFNKHHTSCFLGKFKDFDIVGFKSQFSYTANNNYPFIKVVNGFGFDDNFDNEGIKYHNFFGTYLIGPILILNPYFTKYLLNLLNLDLKLAYEEDVIAAYNIRKKEYSDEKINFCNQK